MRVEATPCVVIVKYFDSLVCSGLYFILCNETHPSDLTEARHSHSEYNLIAKQEISTAEPGPFLSEQSFLHLLCVGFILPSDGSETACGRLRWFVDDFQFKQIIRFPGHSAISGWSPAFAVPVKCFASSRDWK